MHDIATTLFSTLGIAGFAALWAVKMVVGLVGLRWLRDWNARRKGLG